MAGPADYTITARVFRTSTCYVIASGYPPRLHPDDKRSRYKTKKNRKCDRNENLSADIKCCIDKGSYGQIDQGGSAPQRQSYLGGHVWKMGHPTSFSEMQRRKADEVTPAFHMKI
jgi:hypothetical protein